MDVTLLLLPTCIIPKRVYVPKLYSRYVGASSCHPIPLFLCLFTAPKHDYLQ